MPPLCHHILPLTASCSATGTREIAAAILVWLDRPFATTCSSVVQDYVLRHDQDPSTRIWLGDLEISNLSERILSDSPAHNLATIQVGADELPSLGPDATFYNPVRWPPKPVVAGEDVHVVGFPQDQWPAPLRYRYQVQQVGEHRFGAKLTDVPMPGRLEGLRGAPVFRRGREMECIGIVVESLFHNEVLRAQHIGRLAECGNISASSRIC